MKLAFLLYKYFPYGGMQRDFRRFVEESQQRGHQCRIYYHSWEGEPLAGADLRAVPVSALNNHRRNDLYLAWVERDLAADPVDGVVGFNKMPGLDVYYAADSCYLDWVMKERGWWYRRGGRFRHFAAAEKAVFGADSSTEILMIAETEWAKFEHWYHTDPARMHLLPPGISPDRRAGHDAGIRRSGTRQALGVDDEHVLLFVGSGFIKKGLDRAIRALANLHRDMPTRSARLLIAGQDREFRFRRLARRLGVEASVSFLGGRDDVPDLMLAADVLVHPAVDEAAGIVLLEALVAGLPVLVTSTCGYAHHIAAAGSGIVLPSPYRQADLDAALQHSLDKSFLAGCKTRALAYAREEDLYSMHRTGAALIEKFVQEKLDRGDG
jgi:UDP-glucose:(heptosyl)LPS alpha-1,3-glucosyltransferase